MRGDDEAVQLFQGVAICTKPMGKPVEELRMARRASALSEVAGGGHDSGSKVVVPDAVDDDAGEEVIVWMCDPLREFLSAFRIVGAGIEREVRAGICKGGESTGIDLFAGLRGIAAVKDVHDFRFL